MWQADRKKPHHRIIKQWDRLSMKLKWIFWCGVAFCCGAVVAEQSVDPKEKVAEVQQSAPLFYDGKGFYSYKKPVEEEKSAENKLNVVTFFDYDCAACVTADDYLKLYAERNPDKINLVRIPYFNGGKTFVARMHAAFIEFGRPELSDLYLFESEGRKGDASLVSNDSAVERWLENHQIDVKQFKSVFMSEAVKKRVEGYTEMYRKYRPITAPFVSINGKYVLVRNTLYNDDYTYAVLDHLYEHQNNPEILGYKPPKSTENNQNTKKEK